MKKELFKKSNHGTSLVASVQPYKYTGKELDRETGLDWYDSQARMLAPTTGHTTTMDPMCEKYYPMSPYLWCGGNPVKYVGPDGREINAIWLQRYDQATNSNMSQQFISELNFITGLTLSYDENGYLTYEKDNNGEAVISLNNGVLQGSNSARKHIINLISSRDVITIESGKASSSPHGTNLIGLNINQIQSLVDGCSNLDSRTLGIGIVFLHESFHTIIGGSLVDYAEPFETGPVVDVMNQIRNELNELGEIFGKRLSYSSIPLENGNAYLPFDNVSVKSLKLNVTPQKRFNQKFIYIKRNSNE